MSNFNRISSQSLGLLIAATVITGIGSLAHADTDVVITTTVNPNAALAVPVDPADNNGITGMTAVPPTTYKQGVRDMTGWNGNLPYADLAEYYENSAVEGQHQAQSTTTTTTTVQTSTPAVYSPQSSIHRDASTPVNDMTGWNGNAPQEHLSYAHSNIQMGSVPN